MDKEKRVNDIEYSTEKNFRNYNLCLDKVPRVAFDDPDLDAIILQNRPVVITGSELAASASKWTLDYLQSMMGSHKVNVMVSKDHNFMFHNAKIVNKDRLEVPRTRKTLMKFSDFVKRLREWKPGEDRLYLQDKLLACLEPYLVEDFEAFKWNWINNKRKVYSWGPLTSNLLLLGMEVLRVEIQTYFEHIDNSSLRMCPEHGVPVLCSGADIKKCCNVTACHFDEQHNLFAQIHGYKRCILYPPSQYECLYSYPLYHPCDRQSQVNFENPDFEKFPKFKEIEEGTEAIVGPGDVLYIPDYWFHHVESMMNGGHTLSVNFWFKDNLCKETTYPLKDFQKVIISRNVEKMLLELLRDPKEVGSVLRAMTFGRYS